MNASRAAGLVSGAPSSGAVTRRVGCSSRPGGRDGSPGEGGREGLMVDSPPFGLTTSPPLTTYKFDPSTTPMEATSLPA